MYQHINHATMVTILEEARIPFLREPFGDGDHHDRPADRGGEDRRTRRQLRLIDSPLQVTMWSKRVRAVDFTIGYEVRSVGAPAGLASPRSSPRPSWPLCTSTSNGCNGFRTSSESTCSAGPDEPERGIWLDDRRGHRDDLADLHRAWPLRLTTRAVVRLRERAGRRWWRGCPPGFDVLASRVGRRAGCGPPICAPGADALLAGLAAHGPRRVRRPGFRDGLGVAGCPAAGHRLRAPRRRARPCRARPGRSAASRWPRSTRARTGRRRRCSTRTCVDGQLRRGQASVSRCGAYSR